MQTEQEMQAEQEIRREQEMQAEQEIRREREMQAEQMMLKDRILLRLSEAGGDGFCSGQELCGEFSVTRTAVWKAIEKLKAEGYVIEARRNKGYRLEPSADVISAAELKAALLPGTFLSGCAYYPEIDSTNLEVKRRAEAGEQGPFLAVADKQTAGRGRRGRSWDSPPGTGVWMTLLLRPRIRPEHASMLTLIAALAVAAGIRKTTGLSAGIKWPNDVITGGKKICGILTEMQTDMLEISYVAVGIGINVNTEAFPPEIEKVATSLKICCKETVKRVPLIAAVMEAFGHYYNIFLQTEDLSGVLKEYNDLLVNRGREVLVLDPKGDIRGTAEGINAEGELLVRLKDGTGLEVRSGEVSVRGVYGYI